jgi:hypothetical protein
MELSQEELRSATYRLSNVGSQHDFAHAGRRPHEYTALVRCGHHAVQWQHAVAHPGKAAAGTLQLVLQPYNLIPPCSHAAANQQQSGG